MTDIEECLTELLAVFDKYYLTIDLDDEGRLEIEAALGYGESWLETFPTYIDSRTIKEKIQEIRDYESKG